MAETQSLMEKKVDDLTVKDAVKINIAAAGICLAAPVVFFAGAAAYEAASTRINVWRMERRAAKKLEDN